jgi:predicted nucleic acid-binding protein
MPDIVITDTSCFIVLSKIKELDLLRAIYGNVITTPEIAKEFGKALPDWVIVKNIQDKFKQRLIEMQVDKGEASAISLALEITDSIVVLDDYKARRIARHLGLKVTGTLGVIIKAKHLGIIKSIKPILTKISTTDFRISEELLKQALIEAEEENFNSRQD